MRTLIALVVSGIVLLAGVAGPAVRGAGHGDGEVLGGAIAGHGDGEILGGAVAGHGDGEVLG